MTKDVLIRIRGLQVMHEESDDIEMITTGDYYQKNGKHYIIYHEKMEGMEGSVKNTLKISDQTIAIKKDGYAATNMVFQKNKKNTTCYATPMGDLTIGISTKDISLQEDEDNLIVSIGYALDINYEFVSDNSIQLHICSKEKAELRL